MSEIRLNDILKNRNILSPSNYANVHINSDTQIELKNLIVSVDKGVEIGSTNYVDGSNYKFIRTAAFTDYKLSIEEDNNSVLGITSNSFINMNLKEDDILICKDSNVGEVVMLDKDYGNYMFSSGINRLNISENKFYIFAIMKNRKFKEQFISKIPKGATIMHGKNLYLDCLIPFPKDKKSINYIEDLVKIVINKEKEIKHKKSEIDRIIENELYNPEISKDCNDSYKYPKISQLMKINRLDTGNYTEEYSKIDSMIKTYKNGYYYIDEKNIRGGNTPKKRAIGKSAKYNYRWITPTYIYSDGTIDLSYGISCDKNNIKSNCMLIVNRTSKGGLGEYVGISSFYDYAKHGLAQHNQGIYKIINMDDQKLIYMTCLMNSKLYRKYCANLSMGSKMKELKLNNISSIPFPNFENKIQNRICNLYNNNILKNELSESDFIKANKEWDTKAGILDLYESINATKEFLNEMIDRIYNNQKISFQYKIF